MIAQQAENSMTMESLIFQYQLKNSGLYCHCYAQNTKDGNKILLDKK